MTVTQSLRDELVQNHGLPAAASDKEVKAATLSAIKGGKLSVNRVAHLMSDRQAAADRAIDAANPTPDQVFGKSLGGDGKGMGFNGNVRTIPGKEMYSNTKSASLWPDTREVRRKGLYEPGREAFFWETNPKTGMAEKRKIEDPSEYEKAKIGALTKFLLVRDLGAETVKRVLGITITDHDKLLLNEAMHDDKWVGPGATKDSPDIVEGRKLTEFERKAFQENGLWGAERPYEAGMKKGFSPSGVKVPLLEDNTSGGNQAVPQYFDFEAIRTPLLYGELVPFVEITPTDRGLAAHSYSIGTPTFVTTASGTAITPFDATSFVATYDATFFPASCGFQWGRDFEMDAAPNIGQMIVAQMGDQFKYQMDNWIAVGDGTTQPQGLKNASGTVTVTATGTSHQTMVYNDGLNLMYGVTKPYRKAFGGENTMFISTDTMYKKFMQLVTGVTGDTRPIYGMHLKDYQLGDFHFAVQNDIADGTVFACNLRGYRLYRRLGLYFELLTTGSTLTLANLKLLFARARFGGKLTLGGYCAKMTSLQIG